MQPTTCKCSLSRGFCTVRASKKLVFMPVASATAGGHRDRPVLASVAQWPEIQPLVSRGQIISHNGRTHNYNLNIMIATCGYDITNM